VERPAQGHRWRPFIARIVLPVLVIIVAAAVFLLIVPAMRRRSWTSEVIRELTQSAWSILAEYDKEVSAGVLSRDEAQRLAVLRVNTSDMGRRARTTSGSPISRAW
jgi:hypothetical protein